MNCWKLEIKMSITRRSDIISWDHNLPSNQLAKKLLQHKCVVQWLGFSSLIPPIRCIHYIVSSIWVGTLRTAPHCQVITLLADENWRGVDTLDTAAAEPKHWTFIAAAARCCRGGSHFTSNTTERWCVATSHQRLSWTTRLMYWTISHSFRAKNEQLKQYYSPTI